VGEHDEAIGAMKVQIAEHEKQFVRVWKALGKLDKISNTLAQVKYIILGALLMWVLMEVGLLDVIKLAIKPLFLA